LATILLIALLGFVAYALLPFVNAFFGAFIVFFLFKPLYHWFLKKGLSKRFSGFIVLFIVLLVVIVPLFFATKLVITEVSSLISNRAGLADQINTMLDSVPFLDDFNFSSQQLSRVTSWLSNFALSIISSVTNIIISLLVFFFVLYFLLVESDKFNKNLCQYIPFKKKNAERLLAEFKNVTYATIVSTGLIALFQGALLGLGFFIFGLSNPLLWGFIAMVISFLPVVGVPLIWVPAGLLQIFASQNYLAGIGILIWGALVSSIDALSRPFIQKQVGQLHPLITLIGVFMGIPIFGLLGLFIGPLLLSYVVLITKMYVEEYI
jgi:predicted PurR-regulated permease PerM